MAGSAIADYATLAERPRLVALTVNNSCNLKCPHCYLQYAAPNHFITDEHIDILLNQKFEHLAIVGKEPFIDPRMAARTCDLANRASEAGKTVTAITNGLGLSLLSADQVAKFKYFDVSFDGGPRTYNKNRGASYQKIFRNITKIIENGATINVLHVIYKENIENIDDMMILASHFPVRKMMFSPYMDSNNDGKNSVTGLRIFDILTALSLNDAFMTNSEAFFLLDQYHLNAERIGMEYVVDLIHQMGLTNKIHIVPYTPLKIGSLRVTYDGLILSPESALHASSYRQSSLSLATTSLAKAYRTFVTRESTVILHRSPTLIAAE